MTGTSILSHGSARGKAQDRGENGTQGAWVLKGGEDRAEEEERREARAPV